MDDDVHGQRPEAPAESVVARDKIVDLTANFKDGKLSWNAPAGTWTILRIGHTPTGAVNSPAPPDARGPEVDKLSKSALDAHWAGMMKPALAPFTPARKEPSVFTRTPFTYSPVSSPKYQTLPILSWA